MENIMDLSSLAFRGDALERLSSRLHESPGATKRGIESALPVSLAGLAEHASSEGNAANLLRTLKGGNYPHIEARDVSNVVADPTATDRVVQSGSGFLSRIFGSRVGALIDALVAQSGLSRSSATTMLGLATPLVLNSVGKEARTRNLDAAGLSRFLSDQERRVSDRLPANFAASLGGAAAGGGLMAGPFVARERPAVIREQPEVIREERRVVEEPRAKHGMGWLLLGLAALGAIGLIALAFRRGQAPVAAPDLETRAPEVAAPEAPNVQVPEVEVTAKPPAAPEPRAAAPEVAPPATEIREPTPEPAAPEIAAKPAPEAKRQAAAPAAEVERDTSGPPRYWVLSDDAAPLSSYLAGSDPVPQRFLLAGLKFETGSSDISPNAMLDATAAELKESGAKIRIEGHADDQGFRINNEKLSLERAEAVKSYLVAKGVPESNITTKGLSERQPIATNNTFPGRALNRRADLVVIER